MDKNYKEMLEMVKKGADVQIPARENTEQKKLLELNQRTLEESKKAIQEITENELKEQLEKVKESEKPSIELTEEDDRFSFDELGNKIRNLHMNRIRRKRIEERCKKMDISDMLIKGYVEQDVILKPGLVVRYRSLSGHDDMEIKNIVYGKATSNSRIVLSNKAVAYSLTASIVSINDQYFPECRKDGKIIEEKLEEKLNKLYSYPFDFLADLMVNCGWFSERVKELSLDNESIINF
jgi:hypothetical protein